MEAVIACACFYAERALDGDPGVPAEVYTLIGGLTRESTDYSNFIVLEYLAAVNLVKRVYGGDGLRVFDSLIGATGRPILSGFTRACREGWRVIGEEAGGLDDYRVKLYCDRLVGLGGNG